MAGYKRGWMDHERAVQGQDQPKNIPHDLPSLFQQLSQSAANFTLSQGFLSSTLYPLYPLYPLYDNFPTHFSRRLEFSSPNFFSSFHHSTVISYIDTPSRNNHKCCKIFSFSMTFFHWDFFHLSTRTTIKR